MPWNWLEGQELFIVRGKFWEEKINVLTLFTDRWVVYDRFGQWDYSNLSVQDGSSSGPAGSVSGAPAGLASDDDLAQKIALRYMDKKIEERDAKIEEVKASAGDIQFKVTDSLRATWRAAQQLDRSLVPIF